MGVSSPCHGTPFQVQDKYRQTALLRGRDYEAGRTVALILVLCIYYNELVLIYVLY